MVATSPNTVGRTARESNVERCDMANTGRHLR